MYRSSTNVVMRRRKCWLQKFKVTIAHTGLRYLLYPFLQLGLIIAVRLIMMSGSGSTQHSAGPSNADVPDSLQFINQFTAASRP